MLIHVTMENVFSIKEALELTMVPTTVPQHEERFKEYTSPVKSTLYCLLVSSMELMQAERATGYLFSLWSVISL